MAEFTLNYTGAQINTLLGKINNIETTANNATTQANTNASQISTNTSQISTNTSNISALQSGKQDALEYETTSFTAKGVTVTLYKWGRLVELRVNGEITSAWSNGTDYGITTGLADKWLPVVHTLTVNLSSVSIASSKFIVMTTGGVFYQTGGDAMASGARLRATMCYISKE